MTNIAIEHGHRNSEFSNQKNMIGKKNGSSILNVYFEQGKQENSSIIYIYSYIYIYMYTVCTLPSINLT